MQLTNINSGVDKYQFGNYLITLPLRVTKKVRRKYKSSHSVILVLNACYLYGAYIGTPFTRTQVYNVFGWYNRQKFDRIFFVLEKLGYIKEVRRGKKVVYYEITDKGREISLYIGECFRDVSVSFARRWGFPF